MRSTLPITIIALDEASVAAMGMQLPWPRATHAKLVEKLNQAGAMLIVFDMIFDTPSNAGPKDDAAFAEAIRKAGNVMLAADRVYEETSHGRQLTRVEPLEEFRSAGAKSAFAGVTFDSDFEVRTLPQGDDVFWRVIVRRVNEAHPGMLFTFEPDERRTVSSPDGARILLFLAPWPGRGHYRGG